MKRKDIPTGLPHEYTMHPSDLWFKSSYIKKCFYKVQKKLDIKKSLEILEDWKNKDGQLSDGTDLPRLRGTIDTVLIPLVIAEKNKKKSFAAHTRVISNPFTSETRVKEDEVVIAICDYGTV